MPVEIEPLIIVFPNGRSAHDWQDRTFNTEGTHLLGFYYFDFELRHDLIPFIESTYPTRADIHDTSAAAIEYNRRQRAIAGLSMGGMQCLNLIVGGYRHDSVVYTGSTSRWGNGLAPTVPAPGMVDLFSKVGAFSPARTTSDGTVIGSRLAASPYKLEWLYMNCGDADDISYQPFEEVRQTLMKAAGDRIEHFRHALIQDGVHDFNIWFLGAYQFIQQAFRKNT